MSSLLDIGPLTEDVQITPTKSVTMRGVTPEGFFYLLAKFPMLQQLFGGRAKDIGPETMQQAGPTCIAHAIAVASVDRGVHPDYNSWVAAVEQSVPVALSLSAHHQMLMFRAALRLTFPDGIGPFMEAMEGLADSINRVSGSQNGQGLDMTSSKRSRSGFTMDSAGMRSGLNRVSVNSVH